MKMKGEKEDMVRKVTVKGGEMEYIRFGKEGAAVFVILPGLSLKSIMGSADAIVSAYRLIAEDHDVFLFDHIKREPEGYGIGDMAEDTLEAFGVLGIEKADIMGVSMGGMVAQEIAVKSLESVSSLILCSTAPRVYEGYSEVFDIWRELAEKKDAKGLSEAFGKVLYTPSFFEQYRDIITRSADGASEGEYSDFMV